MKNVIKNIAQEIAEEKGFLLINSVTKGSNKKPLFEVYIDNKEGITAKNCAEVSSEIKNRLELTEIGDLDYQLVVSSPGIDESIKYIDQYFKHINREFRLSFDDGEKVQSIECKLIKISDEILTFEYKNEQMDINFKNIKKAKVKISF